MSGQFLEIEEIGDFAGQFDLFVGAQQADPPDFLQINPDGVFGVNAFGADLDAGQGFALASFSAAAVLAFSSAVGFAAAAFAVAVLEAVAFLVLAAFLVVLALVAFLAVAAFLGDPAALA